jgi:hypothetical protein
MTPNQVDLLLMRFGDFLPVELEPRLLLAFHRHMADLEYGGPETCDAFHAFRAGWIAAKTEKTHAG